MKLTYKGVARSCGYRVTNAGDLGYFWYNLDNPSRMQGYGNGKIIFKNEADAWKAACEDNLLVEVLS